MRPELGHLSAHGAAARGLFADLRQAAEWNTAVYRDRELEAGSGAPVS